MPSERMSALLRDAAKCFDDASSPFGTEWLSEHDVTADECIDLSELIGSAIKLYLYLPKDERLTYELKRVINESDLSQEIKNMMTAKLDFDQALKRVNKSNVNLENSKK